MNHLSPTKNDVSVMERWSSVPIHCICDLCVLKFEDDVLKTVAAQIWPRNLWLCEFSNQVFSICTSGICQTSARRYLMLLSYLLGQFAKKTSPCWLIFPPLCVPCYSPVVMSGIEMKLGIAWCGTLRASFISVLVMQYTYLRSSRTLVNPLLCLVRALWGP